MLSKDQDIIPARNAIEEHKQDFDTKVKLPPASLITLYSKCFMFQSATVCRAYQQQPNSRPYIQQPPHRARHAEHPTTIIFWSVVCIYQSTQRNSPEDINGIAFRTSQVLLILFFIGYFN